MRRRKRDEEGTALLEFVWLGILLLVPVVWIVLSVFEVQRGAFAVHAAARAAGRAYVLAPDEPTGTARAEQVARLTLEDQGAERMPLELHVSCTEDPCHSGTSVITVRVVSGVDLPLMPRFLQAGRSSFVLESSHTVPVGQYVDTSGP